MTLQSDNPFKKDESKQKPPAAQSPLKIGKHRKTVPPHEYEETLNRVRNTLNITEHEALQRAGYSSGVANHWRKDDKFPLIAVNALLGLLVGQKLVEANDPERKPLLFSTSDLEAIASCSDLSKGLRASLHREIARRLEE